MKEKFKYFLWIIVFAFMFFAGAISKFSEFIFISHSYLFALIILLIFVVFSLWLILTQQEINKETFNPIVWAAIIIFAVLILTSRAKYDSIFETYRIIAPVFLFLMVINLIRNHKEWKSFTYALVAFGVFIGVISYVQFYVGPGFGTSALCSIWGYQNTFAAFLVLMIMLSYGIYVDTENRHLKMLISTIPMFFIFLLFLTVSRGGYIAFFVAIIAFAIASPKNRSKALLKEGIPIIIGSFLLIIVGSPREIVLANLGKGSVLVNFIGGGEDYSLGMRIYMLKLAFQIFLKKPVFGYGLGTFRYTFAMFNTQDKFFRIDPHSLFFKLLAETGVVGTLAFFFFIGHFIIRSFVKTRKEEGNLIYKGLFAGLTGMIFHMCIDVDIYPIMFVILFFGLALLVPQAFVEFKLSQKKALAVVSIILLLIISISLFPKTVASTYAVKGENPNSFKKVQASIELLRKAIKIDSESSQYQFTLGELIAKSMTSYEESEKISQMSEAYRRAYELNKLDYRPPFRIGITLLFERSPKAIAYLETARELYPANQNVLSWLSVVYAYVNKDANTAQTYLQEAERYNSRLRLDFSFACGILELIKGNRKEAEKHFSTLAFHDEIYRKFDMLPQTYAEGRYVLQLKIISEMTGEMSGN